MYLCVCLDGKISSEAAGRQNAAGGFAGGKFAEPLCFGNGIFGQTSGK